MILRIEDLDPERSKPAYVSQLYEDLRWLGLDWDEGPDSGGADGPYHQAERRDLYQQALVRLTDLGLIYQCFCTRAEIRDAALAPNGIETGLEYPGTCRFLSERQREEKRGEGRRPALRIKVPDELISFNDLCQGMFRQNLAKQVGDFTVQRADGIHAYQLAVVVDDGLMRISHVLRGDDLLASTPRQIWLYNLLHLPVPQFAHVPLLYGADGHRLSKRHGDLAIAALRQTGVKAEKIIGYLAFLAGILPCIEPVAARELIPEFQLERLSVKPIRVDVSQVLSLKG